MQRFELVFALAPAGMFGVPQEGCTVVPARDGAQIVGDAMHGATGVRAGYGTLSEYRRQEDAIGLALQLHGLEAELRDNFLSIRVEADTYIDATELARDAVKRFTSQLSVSLGTYFTADILLIQGENSLHPVPRTMILGNFTSYNLEQIAEQTLESAAASDLDDELLLVGSRYFQHAMWLFQQQGAILDPDDVNARMLVSGCFLNLYKAASTVAGDPSSDKDWQSRYKQLGFTREFFTDRLEELRKLRNDYDVAHYRLLPVDRAHLDASFGQSADTAKEVLLARRRLLLNNSDKDH